MLSLSLAILSLVSAHDPFRLNTQGEGEVNGLNVTLSSNNVLTTGNGTKLLFWFEEEEGEEYGTYFINTGQLLSANNSFLEASESGFESGDFNITESGVVSLQNSTDFWICSNDDGDIAVASGSDAPCDGGVSVQLVAIPEDMDAAIKEYEEAAAALNATSSESSNESSSVSGAASGSAKSAASGTASGATSGSGSAAASGASSANAAVAIIPTFLLTVFSFLV